MFKSLKIILFDSCCFDKRIKLFSKLIRFYNIQMILQFSINTLLGIILYITSRDLKATLSLYTFFTFFQFIGYIGLTWLRNRYYTKIEKNQISNLELVKIDLLEKIESIKKLVEQYKQVLKEKKGDINERDF